MRQQLHAYETNILAIALGNCVSTNVHMPRQNLHVHIHPFKSWFKRGTYSMHGLEQGILGSIHTCALVTWIQILSQTPDRTKHISETHMEPGSGLNVLHATVPSLF